MQHDVRERALLYAEAYALSLITAFLQPKRIFEIGTATGQSTLLMARQAPDAEIGHWIRFGPTSPGSAGGRATVGRP